ncbi:DegT/DnrJ/EryC1/StrS family aminotransferase [Formosa sp. 4Alg 33]|uniref:DegT/DnrJ/EryC1/StrS family aminotransferase n=1 Tax=Formosa sp. 4Alg 33 TaxID=3382189 RepID=UPI003D9C5EF5
MNSRLWLSPPHMSGHEIDFINEAFSSNWIAPIGPHISGFEADLKLYLKQNNDVVALSSGTAALHLALILLHVGPGDEVICQSKTFSASANPIVYQGATPVFVDSERDTWNMCPILLETAIKDRMSKGKTPKAIIAVHLYGMPYKVDEIQAISEHYNIPIVEDSAEALGSTYKGQHCGTFGDYGIFSFNGNKIITTSGGGALVCSSQDRKDKAIFLATQAKDQAVAYEHSQIGYNYRMSNIIAGIGRGQMLVLVDHVQKRRENFKFYKEKLSHIDGIAFLEEPESFYSNRWLTCVLLNDETEQERLRMHLEHDNIESRPLWKPMHQQTVFKDAPRYINGVSDDLFARGLCLPSGSNLTQDDLHRIVSVIINYFNKNE